MIVRPYAAYALRAHALACCIAALLTLFAGPALANKASEEFVQDRANEVMAIINSSDSTAKKKAEIGDIVDESVGVEDIAMFTLGKYGSAASQAEIDDYLPAFRDYLIAYYVGQLSLFEGLSLDVTGSKDLGGNKGVVVTSVVKADSPNPTEVNWRVAGDSSIVDVEIEGVWMAQNLREQIVASLDQNGGRISAAIAVLQELANKN